MFKLGYLYNVECVFFVCVLSGYLLSHLLNLLWLLALFQEEGLGNSGMSVKHEIREALSFLFQKGR